MPVGAGDRVRPSASAAEILNRDGSNGSWRSGREKISSAAPSKAAITEGKWYSHLVPSTDYSTCSGAQPLHPELRNALQPHGSFVPQNGKTAFYSITSSAVASSVGGRLRSF
jgi:hypothetical protein